MYGVCSAYLELVFDPSQRSETLSRATKALETIKFDAIVCKGVSGLAIAPTLADQFGVNLCVVRHPKATDHSHCSTLVESPPSITRFAVVDDFVSSGETMRVILDAMARYHPNAKCAGIFLYSSTSERMDEYKIRQLKSHNVTTRTKIWQDGDRDNEHTL